MNVNSFRIDATTSAFVYGKSEEIKKLGRWSSRCKYV
jgi:hypothetical protein